MKLKISAQNIQEELQRRVNKIPEIIEDNSIVKVGMPHKHEVDLDGCNWSVSILSNGSSYMHEFGQILSQFRLEVDLE